MVDIHSHILFDIDDGAKDIAESISLIKEAINLGYTDIVCSSHYHLGFFENKNYDKNFKILENEIKKRGLQLKIHKGNELKLTEGIYEKLDKVYTINNSKYILLEFPNGILYKICRDVIKELIKLGYKPIIAHIERYSFIEIKEFIEVYNMGVIFQINIRSVNHLSKKVLYLLLNGYIKVVASDTHNSKYRNYDLKKYLVILEEKIGRKKFLELTEINPRKILNNEEIILKIKEESNEISKVSFFSGLFKFIWGKLFYRS